MREKSITMYTPTQQKLVWIFPCIYQLGKHFAIIKYENRCSDEGERKRAYISSGKINKKLSSRDPKMLSVFGCYFGIGHVLHLFCHFHLFASKYLCRKEEDKLCFAQTHVREKMFGAIEFGSSNGRENIFSLIK
jgi:hypothetical protein